jgi:probable rRNA maturation factor
MMNITVEIAKECKDWNKCPRLNSEFFSEIMYRILSRYTNFTKVKEIELSVLLADESKIRSLNQEFRGQDKETNVLSFPDLEIDWHQIVEFPINTDYMYLGDIAFCYSVIDQEAKEKSISFYDHFKHLTIHAILHLIGYDHIEAEDAEVMESLEIQILKSFGISSPY